MLQEQGITHTRRGKLHLDTTQMPGGILYFNVSVLAERAADALNSGIRFVELTAQNAEDWGYQGPATSTLGVAQPESAHPPSARAPRKATAKATTYGNDNP